jgi:hypothetical protein
MERVCAQRAANHPPPPPPSPAAGDAGAASVGHAGAHARAHRLLHAGQRRRVRGARAAPSACMLQGNPPPLPQTLEALNALWAAPRAGGHAVRGGMRAAVRGHARADVPQPGQAEAAAGRHEGVLRARVYGRQRACSDPERPTPPTSVCCCSLESVVLQPGESQAAPGHCQPSDPSVPRVWGEVHTYCLFWDKIRPSKP